MSALHPRALLSLHPAKILRSCRPLRQLASLSLPAAFSRHSSSSILWLSLQHPTRGNVDQGQSLQITSTIFLPAMSVPVSISSKHQQTLFRCTW